VVLAADALAASWAATAERLGAAPGDQWLLCLPAHHVAGLSVLWRSRLSGTVPIVHDGFDVGAVAAALGRVDLVSLVPTQLRRLLAADAPLGHLRAVLLGGARTDETLLAEAAEAGAHVVTTYGMSETCGGCVYDGVPLRGAEVRTDDGGVISLRGPMRFTGYRGDRQRTAAVIDAEGWFRTSDLGELDELGRLRVLGRADDVIITGGEKVVAGEVERVLTSQAGVAEAAVVGRPDPEWGERVVAFVLPSDPARPPSPDALRAVVGAALGAAASPKELHLLDELPRLPTGKVDRVALREGPGGNGGP
jgi:O-succinylbenzoic acid--CoA ligase